jgi:carboxylesterase type B
VLNPNWPAYTAPARSKMIFTSNTRVENDSRDDIRKYWAAYTPQA